MKDYKPLPPSTNHPCDKWIVIVSVVILIVWIGTAVVLIVVLLVVDYKAYDTLAYAMYAGMIVLLLVTMVVAQMQPPLMTG